MRGLGVMKKVADLKVAENIKGGRDIIIAEYMVRLEAMAGSSRLNV